jgi:hypothetical protein
MTSLGTLAPTTSRRADGDTPIDAGPRGGPACDGTVVVHVDQSVECSAPDCPTSLDRRSWRSLHATFVRCGHTGHRACSLCTLVAA